MQRKADKPSVDDGRNASADPEDDVEPKVAATAALEEDGERRDEDGEKEEGKVGGWVMPVAGHFCCR